MPGALHARIAPMALLGDLALAGGLAAASAAGAAPPRPAPRGSPSIHGRRAIAYCGPATVAIQSAGRTYLFRSGLCDHSTSLGGLELNVGTLVQGAKGDAGQPFVSLVIAKGPSESEAFEADAAAGRCSPTPSSLPAGRCLVKAPSRACSGSAFSGSWDCHGVIYSGP